MAEEHEQLKLQLKHRNLECAWASKAMGEINLLTKTFGEELRLRPHELDSVLVGRILQQVQSIERLSAAVERIAATLRTDLQMCEDVDTLALMVRECHSRKSAAETAEKEKRPKREGEDVQGWRSADGGWADGARRAD